MHWYAAPFPTEENMAGKIRVAFSQEVIDHNLLGVEVAAPPLSMPKKIAPAPTPFLVPYYGGY